MIRIDDSLLEEIGLIALPEAERKQLLKQIYDTLEMKVGMRLAERMSDQQLDEFESFLPDEANNKPGDEAGALKWLETNFPDYKQVVADELEKLKVEIKKDAPRIVEAFQTQGGQPAAPSPQPAAGPAPISGQYNPQPQQYTQPSTAPTAQQSYGAALTPTTNPDPLPPQPVPPQPTIAGAPEPVVQPQQSGQAAPWSPPTQPAPPADPQVTLSSDPGTPPSFPPNPSQPTPPTDQPPVTPQAPTQ